MEKELAPTDLPSERKVANTIRKYHFPQIWIWTWRYWSSAWVTRLEVEELVEGREEEMEERVLGREVEQHWQRGRGVDN